MADVNVVVNPQTAAVNVVVNPRSEPDVRVIIADSGGGSGEVTDFWNDTFIADGIENEFVVTYPIIDIIYVDVNGLIQLASSYTVTYKTVALDNVPLDGDTINIYYTK